MGMNTSQMNRWRLILGGYAGERLGFGPGQTLENGIACMELEEVLDFLYNREQGEDVRRQGGNAGKPSDCGLLDYPHPKAVSQRNGGNSGAPCA